jgi:biopolymer transport protein ExbD
MRGPSDSGVKADPNLVPLLDLVFQLIMFFMICVQFTTAQVNEDIKLPVAQSARAMDKSLVDVLFLNMDAKGHLIIIGEPKPLSTLGQVRYYLGQQFADAKRSAQQRGDKSGKVNTTVIIRADRDANWNKVYELLLMCKEAGYSKLQLRAYTKGEG